MYSLARNTLVMQMTYRKTNFSARVKVFLKSKKDIKMFFNKKYTWNLAILRSY